LAIKRLIFFRKKLSTNLARYVLSNLLRGFFMKYQFQFLGAGSKLSLSPKRSRLQLGAAAASSSAAVIPPARKRMHLGLVAGVFALCALSISYRYYLNRVTNGRVAMPVRAIAAVPAAAAIKPAAPAEAPATALPKALKQATDAGVITLGTYLVEAVKIPQPAQQTTPTIPVEPQAIPVASQAAPGFKVVASPPPPPRLPRVLTPEQKMTRAAQAAMVRMLEQANRYPDAYGFLASDDLAEVKLGKAIPLYSVEEQDRATYQSGAAIKPMLKEAQLWVYPVLVGDRICCMVEVTFDGHDYIPGEATKSLALAWNKINVKWPAAKGFHPLLVVNANIPGFFFTIPELPSPNLTDTDKMIGYRPTLSPADVILASWR
jgi:hypothetical protein